MKSSEIKIGKTYRNKGAGTTIRTVIDKGRHVRVGWPFKAGECNVKYIDGNGRVGELSLDAFGAWAGSEVIDG